MKRIILHWSGGQNRASGLDKKHYHFIVESDGTVVKGNLPVGANAAPIRGEYAAHTLGCNTDSIGVSMAGMLNAVEFPFNPGPQPITEVQWKAAAKLVADLARQYHIPITRETILSHAEVQGTLGIKQRQKWDITRLPWAPGIVGARVCGDIFRGLVSNALGETPPSSAPPGLPELHPGVCNAHVSHLQRRLISAGFAVATDGDFGPITERAVRAFQKSKGLPVSGIVDAATWATLP